MLYLGIIAVLNKVSTMAPKELKVLRLLIDNPRGMYGSELVNRSDGALGRGTIYTLLERMVSKGYVKEIEDPPAPEYQLARTRHQITGAGRRALYSYLDTM